MKRQSAEEKVDLRLLQVELLSLWRRQVSKKMGRRIELKAMDEWNRQVPFKQCVLWRWG